MHNPVIRSKLVYCGAVLLAVMLGLGTRAYADQLPRFVSGHFGDAIWAGMIYLAFRVLLTRYPLKVSLILSLCFSFGIEFSQLYQAEWIIHVRSTTAGGLILGQGFLWIDLVRYTAGILFCYVNDQILQN
ncbi:ribosomal maturation YjgA family protein [Paenibacillus sp. FSL R10-2736]|uniref:ribosomal maturation YjgA family protein n=1 Tax=Paenibacillus sp. FSL R10-2736 TaxID=2954692 RepID=UPI0030F6EF7F